MVNLSLSLLLVHHPIHGEGIPFMTMPSLSTRLRKDSEKKGAQGLIVRLTTSSPSLHENVLHDPSLKETVGKDRE